ncbi:hypothetical protein V6N13_067830 [Hibiscus sabdariffa]
MEVNSESYWIKVTTTTYENEKHWIDEGSPEISHDGIDSYHFEDLDIRMDEKENDTISNKELNGFNKVSCEDKHVRKHQASTDIVPLCLDGFGPSRGTWPFRKSRMMLDWINRIVIPRGLGKFEKKAAVRKLIARSKARVVFIQESKMSALDSTLLRKICGQSSNFKAEFSPSVGATRGIISLWDPSFFRGDFNIVCSLDENIGVNHQKGAMEVFLNFVDSLGLVDLPLVNGRFTWSSFRDKPSFSRLD